MKHRNRGFSLAEMLTAVAILAVLCAIAIPGIIAVRNNLEMRRLDDTAREIYMAAQNRLTALESAGTVEKLGAAVSGDNGDRWLFSNDAGMSTLLPVGSVEGVTAENQYAIYYNELSGDVLEVYYSEKTSLQSDGAAIQSAYGEGQSAKRKEDKIGFYKGEGSGRANIVDLPMPTVVITNDEKLTVKVDASGVDEMLLIMIRDADGNEAVLYNGTVGGFGVNTGGTNEIVLDSLSEKFCDLYEGLVPGSDITVTAKLSKAPSETTTYRSAVGSDTDNSLFASVDDTTAKVANLRHLQNLSSTFSGVTDTVTEAEQTQAIDCAKYDGAAYTFQSIYNSVLTSFDGQGNEILNLNVTGAGLFASFSGSTLSNVMLNNPSVSGSGSVGALAGTVTNTEVTGCQVYGTSSSVSGGTVGGLIGMATGSTVKGCSASAVGVSGTTVGGLIGSMMGGSVEHSYADSGDRGGMEGAWRNGLSGMTAGGLAGSMSSGASILNSYAVGYIEDADTAGGIVGSGSGTVSGSYAAITFADGIGTKNAIAPFASTGCKSWSGSGAAAADTDTTLEELSMGSGWTSRRSTVPYTQGTAEVPVCSGHYPYPMFADLTHYGDWPVEVTTVDDIHFYEDAFSDRQIEILFCPAGGTATVYADAFKGSSSARLEVNIEFPSGNPTGYGSTNNALDGSFATYEAESGRTAIQLTNKNAGKLGIYGIDIVCGNYKMRVPVVIYTATLKLNCGGTTNTATHNALQTTVYTHSLTAGSAAVCSAKLENLKPTAGDVNTSITKLRDSTPEDTVFSADESQQAFAVANWEKFQVLNINDPSASHNPTGGPGVTTNQIVDESAGIYVIGRQNDSTNAQYPYAASDETSMNIVGKSVGRAELSVAWAVYDMLKVRCPVEVSGDRIFIKTAAASGQKSGGSWTTDEEYPYKVFCEPLAQENVTLKLSTETFGTPANHKNQSYTWTVKNSSGDTVAIGSGATPTISLNEDPVPVGDLYRVDLQYKCNLNSTTGPEYYASDYVYYNVVHKANDPGETGIRIIKTYCNDQETDTLYLEQIIGPMDSTYPTALNEKSVYAQVNGADDLKLQWYYGDQQLTGLTGRYPVVAEVDGSRKTVAYLSWERGTKGEPDENSGTVTIEAEDIDYYGDEPISFRLTARANNNGAESYATKTVTVNIMQQLKITNPVRDMNGFMGWVSTSFTANRSDTLLGDWSWSCDNNDTGGIPIIIIGVVGGGGISYSKNVANISTGIKLNGDRVYNFTCQYGPYVVPASLTARWLNSNSTFDASISSETGTYYIAETGHTNTFDFVWSGDHQYNITEEPDMITPIEEPGRDTKNSSQSNWGDYGAYFGTRQYAVYSNELGKQSLDWELYAEWKEWSLYHFVDKSDTKQHSGPLYIVGAEFNGTSTTLGSYDESVDTITAYDRNQNFTLDLKSYFPAEIAANGTMTVTSDNPDVVSVQANGSYTVSVSGDTAVTDPITLRTGKYGTAILTANYAVGGKNYTDAITVKVVPSGTMTVHLEPCTAAEAGDSRISTPLYTKDSENNILPLLFSDFDVGNGYDTLYYKAYLTDEGGEIISAKDNLSDMSFYSSNGVAVSCTPAIGDVVYLTLQAENGSYRGEKIIITADFGGQSESVRLMVYDKPSVRVSCGGSDVTDKHTIRTATGNYAFNALLSPAVYTDSDASAQLSVTYNWMLQFPDDGFDGYGDQVKLSAAIGSAVTVAVTKNPFCKVGISVSCTPDAHIGGHALVFLPVKTIE